MWFFLLVKNFWESSLQQYFLYKSIGTGNFDRISSGNGAKNDESIINHAFGTELFTNITTSLIFHYSKIKKYTIQVILYFWTIFFINLPTL